MIFYYTAIVTATWQSCSLLEVFSLLFFCTDPPERRIKYGSSRQTNCITPADPDSPWPVAPPEKNQREGSEWAPWAWALSHLPCSQSSAVSLQIGFLSVKNERHQFMKKKWSGNFPAWLGINTSCCQGFPFKGWLLHFSKVKHDRSSACLTTASS